MENNKKQTALQQFIEKICYFDYTHQKWRIRMIEDEDITSYFEEFKEIEKQQIIDARLNGHICTYIGCMSGCGTNLYIDDSGEQYYKETFE